MYAGRRAEKWWSPSFWRLYTENGAERLAPTYRSGLATTGPLFSATPRGCPPPRGRPRCAWQAAARRCLAQPAAAVVQLYSTCTAHVVAQQAAPRAAILAAAGYSFSTGYVTRMHTTVQQYAYMNSHIHTVRDLVQYSIYY